MRSRHAPTGAPAIELRELKLLVVHREDLVGERTSISSRLRWHPHDLDSGIEPFARMLNREDIRRGLAQRLGRYGNTVQVRICRELVARIGELTRAIDALRAEIAVLARPMAPGLLALPGVGEPVRVVVRAMRTPAAPVPSLPAPNTRQHQEERDHEVRDHQARDREADPPRALGDAARWAEPDFR